jgi:hypothetical protein
MVQHHGGHIAQLPARWGTRMRFLFYARPVFRAWEIVCNHLARWLTHRGALQDVRYQRQLAQLNLRRMAIQRALAEISRSHAHVCAQCGYCCKGTRERDAFLDRVLQNPQTAHLGARRREQAKWSASSWHRRRIGSCIRARRALRAAATS